MGKIINYLDTQSDIQLMTHAFFYENDSRTTELFFLLKGSADLQVNDVSYEMKTDDIVVINKHERYQLTVKDKEGLLFRFSISDFLLSQALEIESVSFNCNSISNPSKNYDSFRQLLIDFIDLYLFENTKTNFLQMSKLYHLLNELSSLFLEQTTLLIEQDERIRQITREIKERYYENISLSEMADLVHMDGTYFSKFFKKSMGMNFKDYLSNIRMSHALQDLVNSEKTITRIAVDNGFFSTNGFNKKFKELYEQTPSNYRSQHKVEKKTAVFESDSIVRNYFAQYKEGQQENNGSKKAILQLDYQQQTPIIIEETWCKILNVGEAEMVLNSNLKQHLSFLQENLHFTYGRIWGVFSRNNQEETIATHERMDGVLDSLLELGLVPWISMNKLVGQFKESNYSMDEWKKKLRAFCRHILNRYGKQNVEQWKIELVSNDPKDKSLVSKYTIFYQTTYRIIKELIPNISIGGGNFVVTNDLDLESFLDKELSDCNFDFYSFVLFPYSNRLVREKRNFQRVTDPDFLVQQLQHIKQSSLSKPIYISEWSNTVSRSNLLNDSLYKGAFIVKSIIDVFDQVAGLGYWLGSDLAQKSPNSYSFLTGGNGLLNKNGLSKPAMHAMKFFDQLRGLQLLYKDGRHLIASSDGDEFFVLGHNYTHPSSLYFLKDEAHLKLTEIGNFFEKNEFEEELIFSGISNGEYELRIFSCLKEHGDLFNQWKQFNFTRHLRASDLSYLDKMNTPLQNLEEVHVTNHRLVIHKQLTTNEFYVINVKKRQ